jgi:hypothetical protein
MPLNSTSDNEYVNTPLNRSSFPRFRLKRTSENDNGRLASRLTSLEAIKPARNGACKPAMQLVFMQACHLAYMTACKHAYMTASKHAGQSVVWLKKPLERFHFSEAKHREDACQLKLT